MFLTLYLGTQIGIFFRFMIMTGFAALLLIISFPLGKTDKWDELSHISRSFSGALFLFAVFASSTIEGLKWIENPLLALGVISAGTIYNLFLGGLCRKKGYMVFHMAINFLVIFLLPTEPLVFWLAFTLTLGLQIFGFYRKEEINSGLSFLLFTIYCFFFKESVDDFQYFSWLFNSAAIIAFVNIILQDENKGKLRIIVSHMMPILWIGSAAYLGYTRIEGITPLIAGTILGGILRYSKSKDLKYLLYWPLQFLLTGTFLILASGSGTQYWLTLLYIETSFFAYWMIEDKGNESLPLLLNYLILICTVAYLYLSDNVDFNMFSIANRTVIISAASIFMMKASKDDKKKTKDYKSLISIFQFILPLFAFLLSFQKGSVSSITEVIFFSILILILLIVSNKDVLALRTNGFWFAVLFPLTITVLRLIEDSEVSFSNSLFLLFPLVILSLASFILNRFKETKFSVDAGVFIFTLILAFTMYFPFWKISTILPSIILLLAAFAYYLWWEKKGMWEIQTSGQILLLLFFFRHISHNLQMENYLGFLNIRLIIEITAILVIFLYLRSNRWNDRHKIPLLNKTLQGPAFTLGWLFLMVLLFSHSNRNILSMVFQVSVILLLYIDRKEYLKGYPLLGLAYIHFIIAQLNLALNSHPSFPFLPGILQNPWIFGFINVGTSIFIIFLFFKHVKAFQANISPVFSRMKKITDMVIEKKNLSLLIPLFTSLGLFFNWTLEATALTIALFCGCFLLYGTASILKENVFRHATSLALLGTSVRLIFWDLAQSTMLARSIAFLGASIIFILINILYSQFKGRFENV